ncbi:MAG: DsrE family protein [Nitrospirae bacterium]|nr:DsrE family protein [Nitrospirota bacterium]
MKLGILVNTDRHLRHLMGLSNAALSMGHEVNIFFMDSGAKLLGCEDLKQLCSVKGVRICFCDFNARGFNISKEGLPPETVCGSQYDNALMVNEADRVVVL